jgi:hypothetical protein
VTRQVAAYLAHRHVNLIRREVAPVACDVTTRAALLDLDEVEDHFAGRPHRNAAALRPIDPAVDPGPAGVGVTEEHPRD